MKKVPWYIWAGWWGFLTLAVTLILALAFLLGFFGPVACPILVVAAAFKVLPDATQKFMAKIRSHINAR